MMFGVDGGHPHLRGTERQSRLYRRRVDSTHMAVKYDATVDSNVGNSLFSQIAPRLTVLS